MHLRRQETPLRWPVERKGTHYLVKPTSSSSLGMPLIVILRDVLRIAQNRKEVREAISSKKVLINGKNAKDEKRSVLLLDVLSIPPLGKFYRLTLSERGKFSLEEIKEADSGKKVSKIMNKRILNGKKTQLNLMDGRNVISEVKCRVNDSVVINFKKNAIEKVLPLEEKSRAFVFEGKYSGKQGKITSIDEKKKMAEIDDGKEKINVLIRQMMVLE